MSVTHQSYNREIIVSNSAGGAFRALTSEFDRWWTAASHPFKAVGDIATFRFDATYWTMRATKLVPDKCVELECIDAHHQHEGLPESIRQEWKSTFLKWNIFPQGDKTRISFVHEGLEPNLDCFEVCEAGWDHYFVTCLKNYLDKEGNTDSSKLKRPVYEIPEFIDQALIETLSSLSNDEMDAILDTRDTDPFDSSWCQLNEIVGGNESHPNAKDFFLIVSNVTNQHEITSYIADDVDLIYRAGKKGIKTPFLRYLEDCYKKGLIPSNTTKKE